MASAELVVHRYALALYELSGDQGLHEQVEAQLADLDGMLSENEGLRTQLGHPRIGHDVKKAVLNALLGDAVCDALRGTVMLMVDKGRAGLLADLRPAYERIAMGREGRAVARVQTAAPLDDSTRAQLLERLAATTGRSITLKEEVDPSLIGGLRVIIGSSMVDGSLKRRLEMLQDSMLSVPLTGPSSANGN